MPSPHQGPLCTATDLTTSFTKFISQIPSSSTPPTILIHSSLRSIGFVPGSAPALITSLLSVLGPTGTLVVPTQTGDNSDPSQWQHPPVPESWWQPIRDATPPYDPATSRTRGMGIVPETLRVWPGALRSAHPQTSFAAVGPNAEYITNDHALSCRLGESSPLARLENINAWVLLIGVGWDKCTAFHLAEYRVLGPPLETNSFAARVDGRREWVTVEDVAISEEGFEQLGADFERDGKVIRGMVGGASCALFELREAVEYGRVWLSRKRQREAA